jgi:mediator of RNA polymerase II transcription subunit 30
MMNNNMTTVPFQSNNQNQDPNSVGGGGITTTQAQQGNFQQQNQNQGGNINVGGGNNNSALALANQQAQQQAKEINAITLCRLGQETVQEIISRMQELFQTLKASQVKSKQITIIVK